MSDIPHCNYELITRWEWFRRAQWRTPEYAALNPLFAQLLKEVAASAVLYCGTSLGRNGLHLAKMPPHNAKMLIHLPTAIGAEHGREIAHSKALTCGFITGTRAQLAEIMPHPVAAIFCPNWLFEPDWATLKSHFQAAFNALNTNGVLAFPAPKEHHNWQKMLSVYDQWEEDTVLWHYRDGAAYCVCLRHKNLRAENYADIKYNYVSVVNNDPQIETTIKRLPAYWSWDIVCDLARQVGFNEITAREFPPDAADRDFSALAVLRKKSGDKSAKLATPAEKIYAYADF